MALYFSEYKKRFSGEVHFFGNASHAMYDLLVWLQRNNPRARPNIVLPIYIPAKVYRMVLAAGYSPRFYDISLNCRMNLTEVKSLVDDQTQAVVCTHFFGIPAVLEELKSFAAINNVFLIEDCTHTLNGNYGSRELGNAGDCAIFSTRRMLQLPSGGFMILNKKLWRYKPEYSGRVSSLFTACKIIQTRSKYGYFRLTRGNDPLGLARTYARGYINFAEGQKIKVRNISRLGYVFIHSVDLDRIAHVRRANYEYLLNEIRDIPFIKPIPADMEEMGLICNKEGMYRLREGIVPSCLPVLVPVGTRGLLLKLLRAAGVGCGVGWPESPFGHHGFDQASELSERLLELPIHQGMSRYQLDDITHCLRECEKKNKRESLITNYKSRKAEVV